MGGHKGVTKTYAQIGQKYFWPKLKTYKIMFKIAEAVKQKSL